MTAALLTPRGGHCSRRTGAVAMVERDARPQGLRMRRSRPSILGTMTVMPTFLSGLEVGRAPRRSGAATGSRRGCTEQLCTGGEHLWTEAKRSECCNTFKKGCPLSSQNRSQNMSSSAVQEVEYNCEEHLVQGWPRAQQAWCCSQAGLGCKNQTAGQNSLRCTGDEHLWSYAKRSECCTNFQKGCSSLRCQASCAYAGQTSKCIDRIKWAKVHMFGDDKDACILAYSTVREQCDSCGACGLQEAGCEVPSFDCDAALSDFSREWSLAKQDWCCRKQGKGCNGSSPPSGNSSIGKQVQVAGSSTSRRLQNMEYNCEAGKSECLYGWSAQKQDYCQNVSMGCNEDCFDHVEKWFSTWSVKKIRSCCQHRASYFCLDQTALQRCKIASQGQLAATNATSHLQVKCGGFQNGTLLHEAVRAGSVEDVKFLLSQELPVDEKDNFGRSPLSYAAAATSPWSMKIAELLLDAGAKVDGEDKAGSTPLHRAAMKGDVAMGELLLERYADVDVKDKQGSTPLFSAAVQGRLKMAQLLVRCGADVFETMSDGTTCVDATVVRDVQTREFLDRQRTFWALLEKPWVLEGFPFAFILGMILALFQASPSRDAGGHGFAFYHGAWLCLYRHRIGHPWFCVLRVIDVLSILVLVFGCGMWVVQPYFWISLHFILYFLPAWYWQTRSLKQGSFSCGGLRKALAAPGLMLAPPAPCDLDEVKLEIPVVEEGVGPRLSLARFFFLVTIIVMLARPRHCEDEVFETVIAQSVCKSTTWVPSVVLEFGLKYGLQNPHWEALLQKPYRLWSRTSLKATLSWEASEKTNVDLELQCNPITIFLICLLLLAGLLYVLRLLGKCFLSLPCATAAQGSYSYRTLFVQCEGENREDAQEANEEDANEEGKALLKDLISVDYQTKGEPEEEIALPPNVLLEKGWACDGGLFRFLSGLYVRVSLLVLDLVLDCWNIHTMVFSGNYKFACFMVFVLSKSLGQQVFSESLLNLRDALSKSVKKGYMRRDLMEIFAEEQGFEACASLALTTYAYWYTVSDASTALRQIVSIAVSVYNLAQFLYQRIDLGIDLEYQPEEPLTPSRQRANTSFHGA
ncbi:unnamed protein product [Durusdinium trenchii]|uniref:Uncharacterized protein n=2 Tax=Durusdinium trenchii TaxID=1381693 RepID=A0ABP0KBE0_9DINO